MIGLYLLILAAAFGGGVIGYFVGEAVVQQIRGRGYRRALLAWQEAWRHPRR